MKFDPLNILPLEVSDEILAYLSFDDVKNGSLVSKHWYNLIGKSKHCMEKLRLKCNESDNLEQFSKIISDSTRLYQDIDVDDIYETALNNTKYLRILRDIVRKFADTLVTLKIAHDLNIKLDLPKLKELKIYICTIASNGLLTKAKGIEKLTLRHSFMDKRALKYVKSFLLHNESLKVLRIYDVPFLQEFIPADVNFKLEKLHIHSGYPINIDFLKLHSSTLKEVTAHVLPGAVAYFMSECPKLEKLSVHGDWLSSLDYDFIEYPYNATIKKLNIYSFNDQTTMDIIDKMQSLEVLHTDSTINRL